MKKKTKTNPCGGGRSEALTPDKVQQLKIAFADGLTIDQACTFAKIAKQTYYNHGQRHPGFLDEMSVIRNAVDIHAKKNVVNLIKEGNYEASKFWLTTKCKDEFSTRTESTGKDGGAIQVETKASPEGVKEVLEILKGIDL